MNGRQRAVQSRSLAQFGQSQIRLVFEQRSHPLPMGGDDQRLAPGITMARGDVAGAAALLEELLDHAQGDAIAPGDIFPGAFVTVVRGQNPFPQIQG